VKWRRHAQTVTASARNGAAIAEALANARLRPVTTHPERGTQFAPTAMETVRYSARRVEAGVSYRERFRSSEPINCRHLVCRVVRDIVRSNSRWCGRAASVMLEPAVLARRTPRR